MEDDNFDDLKPGLDPELQAEQDAAEIFLNGLKQATEYHMELEYTWYVLRALKKGDPIDHAVSYALNEWDL